MVDTVGASIPDQRWTGHEAYPEEYSLRDSNQRTTGVRWPMSLLWDTLHNHSTKSSLFWKSPPTTAGWTASRRRGVREFSDPPKQTGEMNRCRDKPSLTGERQPFPNRPRRVSRAGVGGKHSPKTRRWAWPVPSQHPPAWQATSSTANLECLPLQKRRFWPIYGFSG